MSFESYPQFRYDRKRNRGKLLHDYTFLTPVTGYSVSIQDATILSSGKVIAKAGYEWDFGTGAIDTVAMVVASLEHDVFCDMVNQGKLPKRVRKQADKHFHENLKYWCSSGFERSWSWLRFKGVRLYAKARGM